MKTGERLKCALGGMHLTLREFILVSLFLDGCVSFMIFFFLILFFLIHRSVLWWVMIYTYIKEWCFVCFCFLCLVSSSSFAGTCGLVYRLNLIGVKPNFLFSSQLLASVFPPASSDMTHFIHRGLRNKIMLLPHGLSSLICPTRARPRFSCLNLLWQLLW